MKDRLRARWVGVRFDRETGHHWYPVAGVRLYLRAPEETIRAANRDLWFRDVYFRAYRPKGRDCVVDIGAGLGEEIAALARLEPELDYVAVEIQPSVYECLCLTLAQLPAGFRPFQLAIGAGGPIRLTPTRAGLDASALTDGPVVVETVPWSVFAERHGIGEVDLLKINAEGAEAELLEHIPLDRVRRAIVSVHDFRADRGEGEHFRTRVRVEARLDAAGFAHTDVAPDWIYAERR